jgi:predicted ATP-grasp superfamily ATP-dependent carboligase
VLFLDRFREVLSENFITVIPEPAALQISLDKWATYRAAVDANVVTPRCWMLDGDEDVKRIIDEVSYPCVLKPVASRDWRVDDNWQKVGARKAIGIFSPQDLLAEYAQVARANQRALLQDMVAGADDCLMTACCYLDRQSELVAAFNTHKLVQSPEGFGTGCIVEAADCPEILDPTVRLLRSIGFTGIAEVEYKWDAASRQYKLIEINARPWDQHSLGGFCGTDLAYLAYCEHSGLPMPVPAKRSSAVKWIAEDAFITTALQMLRAHDPKLRALLRAARGKRTYAVWSASDPLPMLVYMLRRFIPHLIGTSARALWTTLRGGRSGKRNESGQFAQGRPIL